MVLTILWHDEESAGYTDYIPQDWFVRDGQKEECTHEVVGPRSGRYKAKCNVSVQDSVVDLDYSPFEEFNAKHGMFIGVLRIQFASSARESIVQVWWKEKGQKKFQPCSTSVNLTPLPQPNLEAEVAASLRLAPEERQRRLATAPKKPNKIPITTLVYIRNPDVVAEVLFRANGVCQQCKRSAPFKRAENGEPFLEVHHRIRLAEGGDDTVENAIAVCPNCHRQAHYG